jgi:hypothetical protein
MYPGFLAGQRNIGSHEWVRRAPHRGRRDQADAPPRSGCRQPCSIDWLGRLFEMMPVRSARCAVKHLEVESADLFQRTAFGRTGSEDGVTHRPRFDGQLDTFMLCRFRLALIWIAKTEADVLERRQSRRSFDEWSWSSGALEQATPRGGAAQRDATDENRKQQSYRSYPRRPNDLACSPAGFERSHDWI